MCSSRWTCTRQIEFRSLPENGDGHLAMKWFGNNSQGHYKMSCICTICSILVERKICGFIQREDIARKISFYYKYCLQNFKWIVSKKSYLNIEGENLTSPCPDQHLQSFNSEPAYFIHIKMCIWCTSVQNFMPTTWWNGPAWSLWCVDKSRRWSWWGEYIITQHNFSGNPSCQ